MGKGGGVIGGGALKQQAPPLESTETSSSARLSGVKTRTEKFNTADTRCPHLPASQQLQDVEQSGHCSDPHWSHVHLSGWLGQFLLLFAPFDGAKGQHNLTSSTKNKFKYKRMWITAGRRRMLNLVGFPQKWP